MKYFKSNQSTINKSFTVFSNIQMLEFTFRSYLSQASGTFKYFKTLSIEFVMNYNKEYFPARSKFKSKLRTLGFRVWEKNVIN